MTTDNVQKIRTKNKNVFLRVSKGHFATSHSHINYYIDVTTQKSRLSEAKEVAEELLKNYRNNTIIDTILCLDGTEVIGTCLADALTRGGYANMNAHQTIYILTPENSSGSQLFFRDNTAPMIKDKHVLILAASVTTGYTAQSAIEAIRYYHGMPVGVAAIFATVDTCMDFPVSSIFNPNDLDGYASYSSHECPICRRGEKIDALVNSHGFSKL